MVSTLGVLFMRVLSVFPLALIRGLGSVLGRVLYYLAGSRRKVVLTNLALCFPALHENDRKVLARQTFRRFAQAWLDRSWLWHGSASQLRARLRITGEKTELESGAAVIFAPHFVGLDAGWTALTQQVARSFTTIYTDQANKVLDAWILGGRRRFGRTRLFGRADGVKAIVSALRAEEPLYLLPDMNYGPEESIFVPFYGIDAATVPSLPRFAKLGRAKVVPVITRMTPQGYDVEVMKAWEGYPGNDAEADTALMNARLQDYIATMPDQYYWVHKRFKTRPPGQPPVY